MNMRNMVLLGAAFAAAGAGAVQVSSVRAVDANGNEAFGEVLVRCEVKAGAEYDSAACSRDVRALRDTGEFTDVQVAAEKAEDGGIDVVYTVVRKRRYQGPLTVTGNTYWRASKIAKLAELKDGFAYDDAALAAAADKVRDEYRKKFFSSATVGFTTSPIGEGAQAVTFIINEGERHKNAKFRFEGNTAFDESVLREAAKQYPWWNPVGWFTDEPATEQDFAEACDNIAQLYRDAGYLDAAVALKPVEIDADSDLAWHTFTIEQGVKYRIGAVGVSGATQYPAEDILGAVSAIESGAPAGAKALKDAAREIEIFCGSGPKALADTHVTPRLIPSAAEEDVMNIDFAVTEGVPVTVRNIVVRGNDYTKDKVIRREIDLSPGDPMLEDKAERSNRRLENLRYFSRVRHYLEKTADGADADGRELRDLVYEVTEKNTGNFMIGVGASSVDSIYGTVELSESNFDLFNPWRFRGAGQKGRIMAQAGPRIQTYEASVTEPYFLDRHLELTTEVYRRQRWFDEYDAIRSGAAVSLAYPVKFWPTAKTTGRLGFRLTGEFVQMDDVEDEDFYLKGEEDQWFKREDRKYGDAWEVPLRVFWEDDTRDKFIFATRGHKTSIYGDIVAGDNEYWRLGFNYRQYVTVSKKLGHVLSFGLRGETVDAFSGHMPIYDRLFLGGPRSIRGVEYREVGPKVYRND
ncbi:MAG: outer membrane protein assembly factor BamA, partial [Kiritimatiellae bacterium]|nr:outer membrane protein assembly factor BamA [Kiritimatiellia bacterium]